MDFVLAMANSGLGHCYLKTEEYDRAADHLKAAIGYLTDDSFVKAIRKPRKSPFNIMIPLEGNLESSLAVENHDEIQSLDSKSKTKIRTLTLDSVITEAHHLLNALESLSDTYVAQREWEKAVYTANSTIDICREFLSAMREGSSNFTITKMSSDGTDEMTQIPGSEDVISGSSDGGIRNFDSDSIVATREEDQYQ